MILALEPRKTEGVRGTYDTRAHKAQEQVEHDVREARRYTRHRASETQSHAGHEEHEKREHVGHETY